MKFLKYQGLGNDFIIIDKEINDKMIIQICDRRFGIGADGVIVHTKKDNNYFMNFFNADGSVAYMCGNGIRCYAQYLKEYEKLENEFNINTRAGLKKIQILNCKNNLQVTSVEMGQCIDYKEIDIKVDEKIFKAYYVNSGTEHLIIEVDEIKEEFVKYYGSKIESNKKLFPKGTNVSFVINKINEIEIMTWERGVGITLACGTAAVASAYILNKKNKVDKINVISKGGKVIIDLTDKNNIKMIGDSKKVFEGIYINN